MQKDINYLQALEKAVKEKYGDLATMNPKHFWDTEKEKEYIETVKESAKKEYKNLQTHEKIELDGMFVPKRLINKNEERICNVCKKYSFNKKDDLYLNKFNSCYRCYMCNIEE